MIEEATCAALRSCLCQLLGADLNETPDFFVETQSLPDEEAGIRCRDQLTAFLRPHGMYPLCLYLHQHEVPQFFDFLRGKYLLGGLSRKTRRKHYVLASGRATTSFDPFDHVRNAGVEALDDGGFEVILLVRLFE